MGVGLKKLGKLSAAEASLRQAIKLKNDYAEAYSNLGNILMELGGLNEAIISYKKAINLKPDNAQILSNLGTTFHELGKTGKAINSYSRSIKLNPKYSKAYSNLGNSLNDIGQYKEAIISYDKAIELKPKYSKAYSNKCFNLNYSSCLSTNFIFEQHLEFEKQFGGVEVRTSTDPSLNRDPKRRLRIGYVSPDFKTHSIACFFEPLLENHTPNNVETFCYYSDIKTDDTTRRLIKHSDHWRTLVGMSDSDAVKLIQTDRIDILVDLAGHSAMNRLLISAQKPAPIQVNWLGSANTTGLSAIDYRFTDIIADPIGKSDKVHSEQLTRLKNTFQCYKGNSNLSVSANSPNTKQGHITFGSFNNLAKVTPGVIKVWSKILNILPTSHLLLKAKQLTHNKDHYLNLFLQEGIAEDRIELHGFLPNNDDHLKLYNSVDICLDPFPFNGATTTCEALWMGVPVITLTGSRHAGRVGTSLLTNLGLNNFIAKDIDSYIEIAIKMSDDKGYLQIIRQGLRDRMQQSSLCDAKIFAHNVEYSYQNMWEQYLNSG